MVDDLSGLGKIVEVISDFISKAIGALIEPLQTRRVCRAKADAEAYAIEKKMEAEAKAGLILQGQALKHLLDFHEYHRSLFSCIVCVFLTLGSFEIKFLTKVPNRAPCALIVSFSAITVAIQVV